MKKLAAVLVAIVFLSGCVAYPVYEGHGNNGHYDRDRGSHRWDRDRDGVANRYDRRPDNPRRY